jgi:hypothetical protein
MSSSYQPLSGLVTESDGTQAMYLLGTAVLTVYPSGTVRIDTDDWRGHVVSTRINYAAAKLRLNLRIFFSKNGDLLLVYKNKEMNLRKASVVVLHDGAVLEVA